VSTAIRVLVVEDDPFLADAHRELVGRVAGFEVIGVARSGGEALRFLAAREIDLVLLDIYLPDMAGLDVVRALRARGLATDVIAVTSARDLDVVRAAVSQGVVQYLLKPFTFAALRDKLRRYADYRHQVTAPGRTRVDAQQDVDRLLAGLRAPGRPALPKGLSGDTLAAVIRTLRAATGELSASQVADEVGVSRVTARRYLEHLAEQRLTARSTRYGGAGRPEYLYSWIN
jgi:response regulator of citrate/malate metabolism